jgi:S-adenosylmethionine hydrolase
MPRPVIALITDFGMRDHYAGTMKGVVLGVCPDAVLVDITHDIPPHDVLAGALELAGSYRYFPGGTVFLVVVDPGVGSPRRAIAAEAGEVRFVAPDNGVLSVVFDEAPPKRIVELTDRRYARPTVSRTFEGRDRFAPAAGWLAKGVALTALGRPTTAWQKLEVPRPQATSEGLDGEVLQTDRFGNLITNLDRKAVEGFAASGGAVVLAGELAARIVQTYGEARAGEVCALFGSTDHLELAVNGDSAASRLGLGRGAVVRIRRPT